jgi:2-polyprenyl-3-methyl-5-hydroxy-6-metoxy-1,4-benzoquinol methylase
VLASLTRRAVVPELMDDPGLDPAEHRRALRGLARINRWSRSVAILLPVLRGVANRISGRPVRVLDVATGAGDVPVGLWKRATAAGLSVEVEACDVSETALAHARASMGDAAVRFFRHDVLADPLPGGYDLVTCSLFLHHLSEADAVTVLTRMREAGTTVAVNDLSRSRSGYLLVWAACRLLTRSPVVHFDGPVSVRAAFTPREALALAGRAGLTGAKVESRWPCRFLLTWGRT